MIVTTQGSESGSLSRQASGNPSTRCYCGCAGCTTGRPCCSHKSVALRDHPFEDGNRGQASLTLVIVRFRFKSPNHFRLRF